MNRLWTLLCLLAFVALPASAQYDTYGGWTKIKGQKTGFFHAERIGGRWWLDGGLGLGLVIRGYDDGAAGIRILNRGLRLGCRRHRQAGETKRKAPRKKIPAAGVA